ncbi:MAG: pilus assembly PilX N-terminal domain-containing protein [Phycisphaerae bacterium]|nr:pilus assembly PilX N-terminal domain-containing protein [Phycisphaerae bacterium]
MIRQQIKRKVPKKHKGVSYILSLIVVMLLGALGMAMIQSTGKEIHKGLNQRDGMNARLAAESGLAYLTEVLERFEISGSPSSSALFNALGSYYNDELTTGSVSYDGAHVTISGVQAGPSGSTFTGQFAPGVENEVVVTVTGQTGEAQRTLQLSFELVPGGGIFDKGIVSMGPIHISGSAQIDGANNNGESDILSLSDSGIVFDLASSCDLAGDIYTVSDDPASVDLSGAVTVAGIPRTNPAIWNHIHLGVEPQELPRPDTSTFAAFATNTLASVPPAGSTIINTRVPAGMNPTFNDNTVIQGVLYIESPNEVTFSGNVSVSGVIVTDDPGAGATADNTLSFQGNASIEGVESLPADPLFDELRTMPGSSILAPGFEVTLTGSMGTVGGTIAAEQIAMTGNATLSVQGMIMNLGSAPMEMGGSTHVTIDRSVYDTVPPGFTVPSVLSTVPSSYTEN